MDIFTIASVIGALSTILGAIALVYKSINQVLDRLEAIEKAQTQAEIHLLKIALLSEELPLEDRIKAGEKYLALGGNGYGQRVYNQLLDEFVTQQQYN